MSGDFVLGMAAGVGIIAVSCLIAGNIYVIVDVIVRRSMERDSKPPISGPRIPITPELREKAVAVQKDEG